MDRVPALWIAMHVNAMIAPVTTTSAYARMGGRASNAKRLYVRIELIAPTTETVTKHCITLPAIATPDSRAVIAKHQPVLWCV